METVSVFTANIGRGASQEKATDNIRRIKQATIGKNNLIIGFQEIDEADPAHEHEILKELWPHNQFTGFPTAVPVLFQRPIEVARSLVTKTCDGRAKVTPARFCVQTVVHCRSVKFVHLNGHYPFNAEDLRRDCHRAWTMIAHQWYEQGYTVITTRDTNWHGPMPKLHPKERVLTRPVTAIDRITVIENKYRVRVAQRSRINLNIDGHDAVGLSLVMRG